MTNFTPVNNFSKYFEDFKKDTKLDPTKNIAEYLAYFNARSTDELQQLIIVVTNLLINKIPPTTDSLASKISSAIKSANNLNSKT